MHAISRSAIFLCLLVMLNDVGPAHFRQIRSPDHFRYSTDDGREKSPNAVAKAVSKRGAGSTLLKYGFKVLRLGSEVLPKLSTMTFVVSAAYSLMAKCCKGEYGKACEWNKEMEKIQNEIETKGQEIDVIQLETKNLQDLLLSINDQFDSIADNLAEIGEESMTLINKLSPNLTDILDETTVKLKEMIIEKTEAEEEVEYADIVDDFFEKIDAITTITVSSIGIAMPTLPRFSWMGKRNLARRKSFKLKRGLNRNAMIKLPTGATDESKGFKSWLNKEKSFVKSKVTIIRTNMNNKFRGAVEKVEKFSDTFGLVYGYVDAALTFYAAIEKFKKCKTAYEESKGAVIEMRKAKETIEGIYNDSVGARDIMFQARDQLKESISSDMFLHDLEAVRKNMAEIQGIGNGMQDMINGVDSYIRGIKTTNNFGEIARMISQLSTSLGGFPFVYRCLADKIAFLSLAIRQCKEGSTLEDIIDDSKTMYDLDNTNCREKLSAKPLTPSIIQQVIDKAAERGGFNKDCPLNDGIKINQICNIRCENIGNNAEQIAKKISWPVERIKLVIPKCGSCLEKMKGFICMARKYKPNITDSEIQEQFSMLTLEEIASVDCNKW